MKFHQALLVLVGLLALVPASSLSNATVAAAARSSPEDLLRQMASEPPDDCSAPDLTPSSGVDSPENQLFEAAKARVADRLNAARTSVGSSARSRAIAALREVEKSSAESNKSWPDENRFHFKVLDLPPAILVQMAYRDQAVFVLFGLYYLDKGSATDPGTKWRATSFADPSDTASGIELFPLHRGPNGRARFLAKVWRVGCAGSMGVDYYGYEWRPDEGQVATEIIKIEGAEGSDETASTHVGRLSTTGRTIQLPYCFFSAVDTWDNPTLCAADSFDLSGDEPIFSGRIYNSPDLVTVAKAIQYAEAHDYAAVRGYCANASAARTLVSKTPPYLFADTVEIAKTGPGREQVVLRDGSVRLGLIKRRSGWLVERFSLSAESR